jgi:hypothetical protein
VSERIGHVDYRHYGEGEDELRISNHDSFPHEPGFFHLRYTFHVDPGHGWLEVPRREVEALGLSQRISDCSYQEGERVYLEEDVDAYRFIEALRTQHGIESDQMVITDHHTNGDSRIRRLPRYSSKV